MAPSNGDVHPYSGFVLPKAIASLARLRHDERTDRLVEAGLGCGRDPWLAQVVDLAVAKITEQLGLKRVKDPKELTRGARSKRAAVPHLPKGWRHVPTVDRVGVVAPAEAFAPGKQPEDRVVKDQAKTLAHARELIHRGFPATALLEARVVYTRYTTDNGVASALAMRDCYLALGRPHLAKRVDEYVASFSVLR